MKAKQTAASSQREKLIVRSEADIKAWRKTGEAKQQIRKLKASGPDPTEADLKAIPALTQEQLAACYRVAKRPVTVRLDPDVLDWLKAKPGKYQQHLNALLRHAMILEANGSRGRRA